MTPELQIAVDNLYQLFAAYPPNPRMSGSPLYGDLEAWNRELMGKPLRELTSDNLSRYTAKAMTTWGQVENFKYFLPRIFELTAIFEPPTDVWVILGKLEYAGWNNWPVAEKESINEFLLCLWISLLDDESSSARLHFMDYFTALVRYYPGLAALLKCWEKNQRRTSHLHLAYFVVQEASHLFDQHVLRGFQDQKEPVAELRQWLVTEATRSRLEEAFWAETHPEHAEQLSWAEQIIAQQIRRQKEIDGC